MMRNVGCFIPNAPVPKRMDKKHKPRRTDKLALHTLSIWKTTCFAHSITRLSKDDDTAPNQERHLSLRTTSLWPPVSTHLRRHFHTTSCTNSIIEAGDTRTGFSPCAEPQSLSRDQQNIDRKYRRRSDSSMLLLSSTHQVSDFLLVNPA